MTTANNQSSKPTNAMNYIILTLTTRLRRAAQAVRPKTLWRSTRLGLCLVLALPTFAASGADGVIYYNRIPSSSSPVTLRRINGDGTGDQAVPIALPAPAIPTVSRDGRRLLVTSSDPGRPYKNSRNVYLQELPVAAPPRRITSYEDVSTIGGVIRTNMGVTNGTDFISGTTTHTPYHKAFSPDGTQVAVLDLRRSGSVTRTVNPDGTSDLVAGSDRIPILEVFRIGDNFPIGTALYLSPQSRTGANQGGDGVDWHPLGPILAAIAADVPSVGVPQIRSGEGTVVAVFNGATQFPQTFTEPVGEVRMIDGYLYYSSPNDYAPAISPDGQRIAYVRHLLRQTPQSGYAPLPALCSIRMLNSNRSNDREVLRLPEGLWVTKVAWSPDGSKIAFDVAPQLVLNNLYSPLGDVTQSHISVVNADGTDPHQLVAAPASFPSWGPAPPSGPVQPPPVATLQNGAPVSGQANAAGAHSIYRITVPANQSSLTIRTSGGQGNCDLFIKRGAIPTDPNTVDGSSAGATTEETITLSNPAAGDYYIVVYGFSAYSGVSLTASYTSNPVQPSVLTTRITSPVDSRGYSSLAQASGTAEGQGLANVFVVLARYEPSGAFNGLYDWMNQRWINEQRDEIYARATGVTSWTRALPASAMTAGRYAVFAFATDSTMQNRSSNAIARFTVTGSGVTPPPTNPPPLLPTNSVVAGIYYGLFAEAAGTLHGSSGAFNLSVSASRSFSGRLIAAGKPYALSGSFAADGTASLTVNRTGLSPLSVRLALSQPDGVPMVSGTVSSTGWEANLLGYRANTNAAALAGKYTVQFHGAQDGSTTPAGHGYGTVTVNTRGQVRLSGALADGTLLTQSAPVTGDGDWPFYVSLYGGRGSVSGWLRLTAEGVRTVEGFVHWERPAMPASRVYPEGFVLEADVIGSAYATNGAVPALDLPAGILEVNGPNFTEPVALDVRLGANNRLINATNNATVLTINPATGLFRGTVRHPATGRPVAIKGAVNQEQNGASGFFLDAGKSGSVVLAE